MIIGIGCKDILEGLMVSGLVYTEKLVSCIFQALVRILVLVVRNIALKGSKNLVKESIWLAILAHVS